MVVNRIPFDVVNVCSLGLPFHIVHIVCLACPQNYNVVSQPYIAWKTSSKATNMSDTERCTLLEKMNHRTLNVLVITQTGPCIASFWDDTSMRKPSMSITNTASLQQGLCIKCSIILVSASSCVSISIVTSVRVFGYCTLL